MKNVICVVWRSFYCLFLPESIAQDLMKVLVNFKIEFQQVQEKVFELFICLAAFRRKTRNCFHFGLSQTAVKCYCEVAAIQRFTL